MSSILLKEADSLVTASALPRSRRVLSLRALVAGAARWSEAVRVAAGAILSHRLRSGLTVLGVVIGVAVVALVAALLEGAQTFIAQQIADLGPGIVRIDKAAFQDFTGDGQAFAEARAKRPDLTVEDLRGLRERLRRRIEVGAQADATLPVQRGNRALNGIAVQGVTPNITVLSNLKLASGRELTEIDNEYRRPVCVIGADVADYLFPERDPVNQAIKIGAAQYEVIGVAAPRGSSFGASQDSFVQLPLGTFAKVFGARSRSLALLARASADAQVTREEVEESVRFALRQQRRLSFSEPDSFSVTTARSVEAFSGRITRIVAAVLYPLTAIALAVGGIVVMNMMLASVTERTREIGVRMAVGARRRDIQAQFLIESTLLTLSGGVLGVVLAGLVIWLAARLSGFPIALPVWALTAALLVSCTVGIVFGVVPARRAARLDPIEALRTE